MGLGDLFNGNFNKWLKNASDKELDDEYEKERQKWIKEGFNHGTGRYTKKMIKIGEETSRRSAERWKNDPRRSKDPNFRWTDENRWEK